MVTSSQVTLPVKGKVSTLPSTKKAQLLHQYWLQGLHQSHILVCDVFSSLFCSIQHTKQLLYTFPVSQRASPITSILTISLSQPSKLQQVPSPPKLTI
jgi:hypothetical protein